MPRQTRWQIKQELDTAIHAIERAQDRLVLTGKRFEGIHDDIFEKFCIIVTSLETVKQVVQQLRDSI